MHATLEGATLGNLDRETHAHGLAVAAGIVSATGIAGMLRTGTAAAAADSTSAASAKAKRKKEATIPEGSPSASPGSAVVAGVVGDGGDAVGLASGRDLGVDGGDVAADDAGVAGVAVGEDAGVEAPLRAEGGAERGRADA